MQTTEKTESTPNSDAESLEWIVAEDEQVKQVSDLDVQWTGTPLFRGGFRTYLVALGFVAVALALATESIAGVTTGPSLVGLEPYTLETALITAEIPLWWLSAVPILIGLVGVAIGVRPIVRALRTTYVLTSEKLYVRTRGIRGDGFTKLPLDRVVDTTFQQSPIGQLLSYGTVTFSTFDHTSPEIQCWAIEDPTELHETVLELEASAASPLERKQEYIRVVPSTGERAPREVINQIRPLHDVRRGGLSWWQQLNPLSDPDPLTFEFVIYSDGTDSPIEFYYTCEQHLSTLYDRLNSAYPDSVEIERVTVDFAEKLITPQQYSYDEFETALENGTLQCTLAEVEALVRVQGSNPTVADGGATAMGERITTEDTADESTSTEESDSNLPLGTQLPSVDLDALRAKENAENRDPGSLTFSLETPVDTGEGVLARPHPDEVEPYGLRWTGSGDPMAAIKKFDGQMGEDDRSKASSHAPLTVLIDHFASTDHPIVFQAAFEGEPDLTKEGEYHIDEIEQGRETLWGEAAIALEELLRGPKNSESSSSRSESLSESRSERIDEIKNEDWGHTFTTNLRAVTVPTNLSLSDTSEIEHDLRNLSTVFDPLAGDYYKLESETLHEKGVLERSRRKRSRRCFNRFLEGEVVAGGRVSRSEPDLHLDPAELCNMVIVPSTEHLTDEAVKETHANPESRTTLPGLDTAQRRQYTTGMVLGQDANSAVEGPLRLPPNRQSRHWLLCGATGSGKSQVTYHMLRSLAETTPGPNVLFDPKGDNMCKNYLMAHYKRFGNLDDVYYFREPGTLPAISFFDIRSALEGNDRETAVKEKVDHFHELMRMIMGAEKYEQAFVANEILTFLIQALFDPKHGDDVFGLDDLVEAATRMHHHQELPEVSEINADIHDSLAAQFAKDENQFDTTMGAVMNRLNKLKEDRHLHWMLRHKPGREAESTGDDLYGFHQQETHFDFSEFLDEDVTILFDLGDLTLDAQRGFTTVMLSDLWHSIQRRRRTNPENVVNVIMEEAAPFVATELVADQLLPQGRSSGLSLGFIMQYPEQVKKYHNGTGAYEELLTEVHTKLIGDISMKDRFAKTFTHDELSVEDVRNRNNRMAAGEWFTKLVSPGFGEDRPAPLTLHSPPIISGHPESDEPLTAAEQQQFDEELLPEVLERTEEEYGLYVPSHEDAMEWSNWSDTDRRAGASPALDEDESEKMVEFDEKSEDADGQQPLEKTSLDDGADDQHDDRDDRDLTADTDVSEIGHDSSDAETTDDDPVGVANGAAFFDPATDEEECPVSDDELRRRGLSQDDAIFLKRVLDAMNRDRPGYTLLEGMGELQEDLDGLDTQVLLEQGLLEKETVNRHTYYTVLPAGRELLDETLTAEEGVGDLGEKTPHKVGVELLWDWLTEFEVVEQVYRYYQHTPETIFDVAAVDADDELVWVGEVEMASNNAEAVVSDYDKMAAVDADAVWVFPSRDDGRGTVKMLADAGRLPGTVSGRDGRSLAQIQERVESFESDGMTTVQTLRKLDEKVTGGSS
ncbi:PH domain-containing protein [Natrinema soli]|uniref:PH domain-containing protein n=1 Tax=Natrinema soli TaxID=1930624 RepID=A0ABD5SGH9_9EURY|nr:PH domain-containing protein [Natrinema soli]